MWLMSRTYPGSGADTVFDIYYRYRTGAVPVPVPVILRPSTEVMLTASSLLISMCVSLG